jgi:hypothetical protein
MAAKSYKKLEKKHSEPTGASKQKPAISKAEKERIHQLAVEQRRKRTLAERLEKKIRAIEVEPKLSSLGWSPLDEKPSESKRTRKQDLHGTAKKVRSYCSYKLMKAADIDIEVLVQVAKDSMPPYTWESQHHRGEHEVILAIIYAGSESRCYYSIHQGDSVPFKIWDLDSPLNDLIKIAGSGGSGQNERG